LPSKRSRFRVIFRFNYRSFTGCKINVIRTARKRPRIVSYTLNFASLFPFAYIRSFTRSFCSGNRKRTPNCRSRVWYSLTVFGINRTFRQTFFFQNVDSLFLPGRLTDPYFATIQVSPNRGPVSLLADFTTRLINDGRRIYITAVVNKYHRATRAFTPAFRTRRRTNNIRLDGRVRRTIWRR